MPVKDAKVFPPNYNERPGMNNAQRDSDSKNWDNTIEMLTKSKFVALGDMSGPQVGSPYDGTAMGEDRDMITFQAGTKGKGPKAT